MRLLVPIARRLRRWADRIIEADARARWLADPDRIGRGCDSSCRLCGYLCVHCGRPT